MHFNLKYKIINAEYAVFQFGDYDSKVHLKNHIKNMTDDSSQHFDINSVSFCHKWYLMYIRNIFLCPLQHYIVRTKYFIRYISVDGSLGQILV